MRNLVCLVVSLVCVMVFSGVIAAADEVPSIVASVDRKTILIGERIRYTITCEYSGAFDFGFPEYPGHTIGDFEIKGTGDDRRTRFFGRTVLRKWLDITVYVPGTYTIPAQSVAFHTKGKDDWRSKKTLAIDVTVQSVLPRDVPIADIKGIKGPFGYFELNWKLIGGGMAGILLFIGGLWWYIRARSYVPPKPPDQAAIDACDRAQALFAEKRDAAVYYDIVSDAIRRYIESVFRLKAPEMTTEEFLRSLENSPRLTAAQKELLMDFMNTADLVKFARYAPAEDEIASVDTAARTFIAETKGIIAEEKHAKKRVRKSRPRGGRAR